MNAFYMIIAILIFAGLAVVLHKKNHGHHHCNKDCANCLHPCHHGRSKHS